MECLSCSFDLQRTILTESKLQIFRWRETWSFAPLASHLTTNPQHRTWLKTQSKFKFKVPRMLFEAYQMLIVDNT